MLSNLFEQHFYFTVLSIIALVLIFLLYRYLKIKELQKGEHKNIWDLSLFPGISKLFWTEERPIVIAICVLILIAILALITEKSELWDLFKVNLGVVFGIIARWAEYKIKEKREPNNKSGEKKG